MDNLVYIIESLKKNRDSLYKILNNHEEIRFVSFFGIDFLGNDTDERIPVDYFKKNIENIFSGGIQTDGSSVNLPNIASLSDAKLDFIVDFNRKWFVDYNYDNILESSEKPVGTLKIPVFFKHHDKFYDSRSVLKNTLSYIEKELLELFDRHNYFDNFDIKSSDVEKIYFTFGTELEFWVRTPADQVSVEELALSQMLKESYWKRTKGRVRTCLEKSLSFLQKYNYEPEMGHKEVGGVKGKVSSGGDLYDVMQQLEVDWKYSDPLNACDNELFARVFIKEIFRKEGLEVTFDAKPVEKVAGSGEHMHMGMGIKLKNGKKINLFAPKNEKYNLSSIGYSAMMGVLKNWNVVHPFISHSIDSLKRLKPGYEAPVSPVATLKSNKKEIFRNRSVLLGIVRSDNPLDNPLSVRFELRAPNPHTNSYLASSAVFLSMLDGIKYGINKNEKYLIEQLSKESGDEKDYLDKKFQYLTDKNIFEDYTENQRISKFGKSPETVWENIKNIDKNINVFEKTPLSNKIIKSFYFSCLNKWKHEILQKEIPKIKRTIKNINRFKNENSYDKKKWAKIEEQIDEVCKTKQDRDSLLKKLRISVKNDKYENTSELLKNIRLKIKNIKNNYKKYCFNFI